MEQETKYSIKDKETADIIWNDVLSGTYGEPQNPEELPLNASYFDTKDMVLKAHNIALRTRCEGLVCFATLKWGGSEVTEGLHSHEEVNIPVDADSCYTAPPIELFENSIDGKNLSEIIGNRELQSLFLTEITRRRTMISYNESIMEIAIDSGKVIAGDKEAPISEIEIELYNGELDAVLKLTDVIAEKYGLSPENRSKYARAMELLNQ